MLCLLGNTVFTELSTGKYCAYWEILCYLLGNSVLLTVLTAFIGKYYAIYWEMLCSLGNNVLLSGKYCVYWVIYWEILCLLGKNCFTRKYCVYWVIYWEILCYLLGNSVLLTGKWSPSSLLICRNLSSLALECSGPCNHKNIIFSPMANNISWSYDWNY